jgi:L-asparaginase
MPTKPALIIHVGAGAFPKDLARARRIQAQLTEFCEAGFKFLNKHSAVETAVEIVRWLEDWPETNAGTGSMLQLDGEARLSASLMNGHEMKFSGVVNVEKIKNPILIARLLQKEKDRILSGEGAFKFAKEKGFKTFDHHINHRGEVTSPLHSKHKRGKYGTVGACALDRHGHLAAATSTGGKGMERVGRVSDSCLPAGNFANFYAAVSATGIGEDIVEESLASAIATRSLDLKNVKKALAQTFSEAKKRKRRFAVIALDRNGNTFYAKTTEILYYASHTNKLSKTFSLCNR